MRQWRVGSMSMGVMLIVLGILLILSRFNQWDVVSMLSIWIPIILIVLGIEMLIYLLLYKKEQPVIKYDVFSILFICLIGFVTTSVYVVSTTGVLAAVSSVVEREETHGALPLVEKKIDQDITKVVVKPANMDIAVEPTTEKEVSIFGTYRSDYLTNSDITEQDMVLFHQSGDTLYIQLLEPPRKDGIVYGQSHVEMTVSIPGNMDVEVRNPIHQINVSAAKVTGNWYFESVEDVMISDVNAADLRLEGTTYPSGHLEELEWDKNETVRNDDKEAEKVLVSKTFGEGTNTLKLGYFGSVNVY